MSGPNESGGLEMIDDAAGSEIWANQVAAARAADETDKNVRESGPGDGSMHSQTHIPPTVHSLSAKESDTGDISTGQTDDAAAMEPDFPEWPQATMRSPVAVHHGAATRSNSSSDAADGMVWGEAYTERETELDLEARHIPSSLDASKIGLFDAGSSNLPAAVEATRSNESLFSSSEDSGRQKSPLHSEPHMSPLQDADLQDLTHQDDHGKPKGVTLASHPQNTEEDLDDDRVSESTRAKSIQQRTVSHESFAPGIAEKDASERHELLGDFTTHTHDGREDIVYNKPDASSAESEAPSSIDDDAEEGGDGDGDGDGGEKGGGGEGEEDKEREEGGDNGKGGDEEDERSPAVPGEASVLPAIDSALPVVERALPGEGDEGGEDDGGGEGGEDGGDGEDGEGGEGDEEHGLKRCQKACEEGDREGDEEEDEEWNGGRDDNEEGEENKRLPDAPCEASVLPVTQPAQLSETSLEDHAHLLPTDQILNHVNATLKALTPPPHFSPHLDRRLKYTRSRLP
ncbi:hypothetical protein EWM64_g8540 [Hericium alpestre]|uniref:Uncharacterized protein n=1 Tax=Hericium alpestre TaxID=135208 RepID=A0A4Y9ZL28_9AGAM|nr:hypothetical protein EWM64_g8540 [Hericium alpestre]